MTRQLGREALGRELCWREQIWPQKQWATVPVISPRAAIRAARAMGAASCCARAQCDKQLASRSRWKRLLSSLSWSFVAAVRRGRVRSSVPLDGTQKGFRNGCAGKHRLRASHPEWGVSSVLFGTKGSKLNVMAIARTMRHAQRWLTSGNYGGGRRGDFFLVTDGSMLSCERV